MSWTRRFAGVWLTAVVAMPVAGCASEGGSTDGGMASCAYRVDYDGREYGDVAHVEFTVGAPLGSATEPPCDDTGGDEGEAPATKRTAYAVDGISPHAAIAVGDTPDDVRFVAVRSANGLPPEVKSLIATP